MWTLQPGTSLMCVPHLLKKNSYLTLYILIYILFRSKRSICSLEDYLEELGHDNGSLAQHQHSSSSSSSSGHSDGTNFAQAALLLQNAGSVYSRKVEYLHGLVYAALEHLNAHNHNRQNQDGNKGNGKKRNSSSTNQDHILDAYDPDVQFLLLDDVLPLVKDVPAESNLRTSTNNHRPSLNFSKSVNTTRLSLGNGMSVTGGGGAGVGVGGGASRAFINELIRCGSGATGFRLVDGGCDLADGGVLLLPGSTLGDSDESLINDAEASAEEKERKKDEEQVEVEMEYNDALSFGDDDDGYLDVMQSSPSPSSPRTAEAAISEEEPTLAATRIKPKVNVTFHESTKKDDPWLMLDPHYVDSKSKPKPLKVGKTYKLPKTMDNISLSDNRKRNQDGNIKDSHLNIIDPFATLEKKNIPLKGLVHSEFEYLAKEIARRNARERRAAASMLRATKPHDDNVDEVEEQVEQEIMHQQMELQSGLLLDDDDYNNDFDCGDDNDDNGLQYKDNHGMLQSNDRLGIDDKTFEQLCRIHLQRFARGAENYAYETQLTRRVDHWQSRLAPILEEENHRPEFDIHAYGRGIVDELSKQKKVKQFQAKIEGTDEDFVDFRTITRGCESYQVGRLFLASLMLANTGNVDLIPSGNVDGNESCDDELSGLSMKLLKVNLTKPMDDYQPPDFMKAKHGIRSARSRMAVGNEENDRF